MPSLSLSYDNPVTAVFLRLLAWELFVANKQLKVQDVITDQVQAARHELGLAPFDKDGGGAPDFIQKLRLPPNPLLSAKNTPPKPAESKWKWPTAWRLLYLPPHNRVRQLSDRPICDVPSQQSANQNYIEYLITLRNPAVPLIRVFLGSQMPANRPFRTRSGLYFLRQNDSLYLGKTGEFDTRLSLHKKKTPTWWVFVSIEDPTAAFAQDALSVAEALLISFFNEVCVISNQKRGADQKPGFASLQQGILLSEAASAVMIWLMREKANLNLPSWSLPFKRWRGKNWPDCYLTVPDA